MVNRRGRLRTHKDCCFTAALPRVTARVLRGDTGHDGHGVVGTALRADAAVSITACIEPAG
jgi:hypothetical protein